MYNPSQLSYVISDFHTKEVHRAGSSNWYQRFKSPSNEEEWSALKNLYSIFSSNESCITWKVWKYITIGLFIAWGLSPSAATLGTNYNSHSMRHGRNENF